MGVRVEVSDGETVQEALGRLRELLREEGQYSHARWHKKRHDEYQRPSVFRRRRRWVAIARRLRGWGTGPEDDPSFAWELRPRRWYRTLD